MATAQGYAVPLLAEILHAFPHLDLTFQSINSTFNLDNQRYKESLVFWAAIPVMWLLLTLIIFLLYFCYRCCQRDVEKRRRVPCLKWSMAILALLTCGAVGVGFYGNEGTNKGIEEFTGAVRDANATVLSMKVEIRAMQVTMNNTVRSQLGQLRRFFSHSERAPVNASFRRHLTRLMDDAMAEALKVQASVAPIDKRADSVATDAFVAEAKQYAYYRWVATIMLLVWKILLCLILLLGIGRNSKCTLLMFCAFGIFTLVLCWMSAGLHLGVAVGAGDFCVAPNQVIADKAVNYWRLKKDVTDYYIRCNDHVKNPFKENLKDALNSIAAVNKTVNTAVTQARSLRETSVYVREVYAGLDAVVNDLQKLTALVQCTNIHKDYTRAVKGICYTALPGVMFILLSAAATGFLFTILVLLASRAWRHFGKSAPAERTENASKGYLEVDEDDPFLPHPDNASPSYYSFTRGHRGMQLQREHMATHRRGSPPPAYNPAFPETH